MPALRPFRGLRYDAARQNDFADILCPPYDVISVAEREALLARNARNAVRLELPAQTPTSATDADYARAADTLASWIDDGTLTRDGRPMIYVYEQRFADATGAASVARSFFCELALEDYGPASGVRPHERTHAAPREHRFQLLSAVRTHLSPVMLMYDDGTRGADAAALLDVLTARAPNVDTLGPDGFGQRLWAVDPATSTEATQLLALASRQELYIADGHHRYETALRYRDSESSPEAARHVLALLFESISGGLQLAPWHRVLAMVPDVAAALACARELYSATPADDAGQLIEAVQSGAVAPGVLGMWTRAGGLVLEIEGARVAPLLAGAMGEQVRWLDVSVLSGTLGPMIGSSEAELTHAGRLSYTHDAREAVKAVDEGRADVCFLLRPTPVAQVIAVAAAGEFMPPKSTYFYPKAATGLVFDPLF